jgi:hypothetical protein
LYLTEFLPGKLTFYGRVLKSIACVALACKAADEIIMTIFKSFGLKKINELVVTSNKLTIIPLAWLQVVSDRHLDNVALIFVFLWLVWPKYKFKIT